MSKKSVKNIILFVGPAKTTVLESIHAFEKKMKQKVRVGFITDIKTRKKRDPNLKLPVDIEFQIICDTTSDIALQKALSPYKDELLLVTCRGDNYIPILSHVIPHVPYLKTPSPTSLLWATDKLWMRRRLYFHNKKITPTYTLVSDTSSASLKKIEEKVGFPLIVKPTGLGASRLVSIVYHKTELKDVLKKIFRKLNSVYKENDYNGEQKVLVEQFMDGEMYSIDGYVTGKGKVYFCPLVHVKTGRSIGFDDFFGYQQGTPALLKKENVEEAEKVAQEAVHALALRYTTVHIEIMRTEHGWKIIELGPRIGGFRQKLYHYSFGIDHGMNDLLVRVPEKPIIPKKVLGHSMAMKFFAPKEGRLKKLTGIKKSQELTSFKKIMVHKKIGELCRYAKHGGSSVFDIILFNKERSKLLADIRRLEQMIKIETE